MAVASKATTKEKVAVEKKTAKTSKPVKAEVVVAQKSVAKASTKPAQAKTGTLTADVYNLDGSVTGKVTLPSEVFGEKVNKTLLSQAVRVYLANKRQGTVSTKTRGEVDGSTRKIYRQKGTGRARHGSLRAPIFVKGGVVFGPKPRDFSLDLPQKMRRKALFSALSGKLIDNELKVLGNLEKIEPKTKLFVQMLKKLGFEDKGLKVLLVTSGSVENVKKASRNIQGVSIANAKQLNAYDVLNNKQVLFMKDAIDEMVGHFTREGKHESA